MNHTSGLYTLMCAIAMAELCAKLVWLQSWYNNHYSL